MADLPAQHPSLSLHLADDALAPLITSSRSRAHLESLTALATSALTSQTAAHRVGMGAVERIMVEYPPPAAAAVVLQSYLHPPSPPPPPTSTTTGSAAAAAAAAEPSPLAQGESSIGGSGSGSGSSSNRGNSDGSATGEEEGGEYEKQQSAPRLVSVVVARSPQEAREAQRASARLERVGREFQSQWSATGASS
ncbi:hypothetical protein IF1G_08168 [Cordyceps javanica]|uniref:Uncharacterized protein n=1 Tax=Cordyceps javanica TaxID=43265 RepID=A0A545VSS0_9HYPO|nr:hypothetical protein IF1G_08168 [Cordyceps javanica]TQW04763.1 hypothetical protein IF2G_07406 [Cordyceps javanica]